MHVLGRHLSANLARVHVAIATCAPLEGGMPDDHRLAEELAALGARAGLHVWDDPAVDWDAFDLVVIRSTWDYTKRRDEFVVWAQRIGERLRNSPAIVRWNSDKRYLGELAEAGLPVIPTSFVEPGDGRIELTGEVVVKPTVSAGARDTGRFGPAVHDRAGALIERILAAGRTAMVQPYLASVDERGETALVYLGGELSHVLRKRAVLAPDEEAPLSDHPLESAAVMWAEDLVTAGSAGDAERGAAEQILAFVAERLGGHPLYARVDLLADERGEPVLGELELIEPGLYLGTAPRAAERFARAILAAT
jgi:hypothetical protein